MLCAVTVLSSCGSTGTGTDAGPDTAEATPPTLAAAVISHYDEHAVAIAPLLDGPRSYPVLPRGGIGVEVAFDRAEGDNTHIEVMVYPTGSSRARRTLRPDCGALECVDISTDDVEATMVWEPGYRGEDPGFVYATATSGDHMVTVRGDGPFVSRRHDGAEVVALGDAVAAVATDPAVGPRTSTQYAAAGREICDGDAWLDWYGQGNGSPKPDRYVDWCGPSGSQSPG